jgi:NAD(P)-dependent dehydrogenase (short-subunit alcohol dehydrogenase family)
MSQFPDFPGATQVASKLADHIANKVVLITGTSPGGLGATAAIAIAPHKPALLILAGRNRNLVEETQKALLATTPDLKTRLLIFDLGSLKSVREAAAEVKEYPEHIGVLINNAGIMAAPLGRTPEGYESHLAVNHLGHFLFTNLLVDKLAKGAKIINVSSDAYAFAGIFHDDPNFEVGTKFCDLSWVVELRSVADARI